MKISLILLIIASILIAPSLTLRNYCTTTPPNPVYTNEPSQENLKQHNTRYETGIMSDKAVLYSRYLPQGNTYTTVKAYQSFTQGITIGGVFTVSFWINLQDNMLTTKNDYNDKQLEYILNVHDEDMNGFGIMKDHCYGGGADMHVFTRQEGQGQNNYYFDKIRKDKFGTWMQYTIVFKENGHIIVYNDGKVMEGRYENEQRVPVNLPKVHRKFAYIGTHDPESELQNPLYGHLDEFKIYDRELSVEEIYCLNDLCSYKCDKCSQEYDNCVNCSDASTRQSTSQQCACKSNYIEFNNQHQCVETCSQRTTSNCSAEGATGPCEVQSGQCVRKTHQTCESETTEPDCKSDDKCIWQDRECKTKLDSRCPQKKTIEDCNPLYECEWIDGKCTQLDIVRLRKCDDRKHPKCLIFPQCDWFRNTCKFHHEKCLDIPNESTCGQYPDDCFWKQGCFPIDDYKHCEKYTTFESCDADNICDYLNSKCTTKHCTEYVLDNSKDFALEKSHDHKFKSGRIKFTLYLHDGRQHHIEPKCFEGHLYWQKDETDSKVKMEDHEIKFKLLTQFVHFDMDEKKLDKQCVLNHKKDGYNCEFIFTLNHGTREVVSWHIQVLVEINPVDKSISDYTVGKPEKIYATPEKSVPIPSNLYVLDEKTKQPTSDTPKLFPQQFFMAQKSLVSSYLKERFVLQDVDAQLVSDLDQSVTHLNLVVPPSNVKQNMISEGKAVYLMPEGLTKGSYTLKVISELVDNDNLTGLEKPPVIRRTLSSTKVEIQEGNAPSQVIDQQKDFNTQNNDQKDDKEDQDDDNGIQTGSIISIVILSIALVAALGVIAFCHFRQGPKSAALKKYEMQSSQAQSSQQ